MSLYFRTVCIKGDNNNMKKCITRTFLFLQLTVLLLGIVMTTVQAETASSEKLPVIKWSTRHYFDATPQTITISFTCERKKGKKLRPDGYVIYRYDTAKKAAYADKKGAKYQKLAKKCAVIKKTEYKTYCSYTDKDVKPRRTYYYRVRTYKMQKGKKLLGRYSSVRSFSAINGTGRYSVKLISDRKEWEEHRSVVLRIKSAARNGDLVICGKGLKFCSFYNFKPDIDLEDPLYFPIKKLAVRKGEGEWVTVYENGKIWKTVTIKEKTSADIRIELKENEWFQKADYYPAWRGGKYGVTKIYGMKYDGCTSYLTMDLEKDDTLLAIRREEELIRDTYYGF